MNNEKGAKMDNLETILDAISQERLARLNASIDAAKNESSHPHALSALMGDIRTLDVLASVIRRAGAVKP